MRRIEQAINRVYQEHRPTQLYSLELTARELAEEIRRLRTLKHVYTWHEDDRDVLWYAGGIPTEPPWVGSPLDSAWVDGEFEYWSPIPEPLTE